MSISRRRFGNNYSLSPFFNGEREKWSVPLAAMLIVLAVVLALAVLPQIWVKKVIARHRELFAKLAK